MGGALSPERMVEEADPKSGVAGIDALSPVETVVRDRIGVA